MPRTPNPDNIRMIAETKALIDGGMKPKDAIAKTGIKASTYRSWANNKREREANQRALEQLKRMGVSVPTTKWKHRVTK